MKFLIKTYKIYRKAGSFSHSNERDLKSFLRWRETVAVGETGLDSTWYQESPEVDQVRVFEIHIRLAMSLHLPLIVHLRGKVVDKAVEVLENTLVGHFKFSRRLLCFSLSGKLRMFFFSFGSEQMVK